MGRSGRDHLEGARRVVLVPNCIRDHLGARRDLGYRGGVASPEVEAAGAGWRAKSRAREVNGGPSPILPSRPVEASVALKRHCISLKSGSCLSLNFGAVACK